MSIEDEEGEGNGTERGLTSTPVLPVVNASSSSSSTGTGVGVGFKEPTTMMLRFLQIFEDAVGEDNAGLRPALQTILLKRGLATKLMLSSLIAIERLTISLLTTWTLAFGADLAETGVDALTVTQEEFAQAHGPGGEHYEPPPRGIGSGLGAAPGGSSTSSSSLSEGLPLGTLPVALGAASNPSGEKYRSTMTVTRDKDGINFYCNRGDIGAKFVSKWQHVRRVMTELRLPFVITADADLTTEWYLEKLIWISERFRENRKVDPGWSTVADFKSVEQLRVFSGHQQVRKVLRVWSPIERTLLVESERLLTNHFDPSD